MTLQAGKSKLRRMQAGDEAFGSDRQANRMVRRTEKADDSGACGRSKLAVKQAQAEAGER